MTNIVNYRKPTTAITPNPKKSVPLSFATANIIKKVASKVYPKIVTFPSRDVNQLWDPFRIKMLQLQKICWEKHKIRIIFTNTYRSHAYQAALHKKMPDGAAPAYQSMHEYRCACDVCINDKKNAYNAKLLTIVGKEAEALDMTWGGRFKNIDMPHIQYTGKYTETQIRKNAIGTAV